ncbi:MAG: excinuclease ABC subunit UvrC [Acidobacteria bacterium]|nr:excinuclease ABC subunit UvrC [Acidobacteriota bacterium]MBI3658063.1 excinuclease ABC subunit UvrC [Acidobacteriota bacterium]
MPEIKPLAKKLEKLPAEPGVYIFRNDRGEVLYIGKAKLLKMRVRSYFQDSRPCDSKTERLLEQVADLEYIVTDNEIEALILESNLIKQNQPPFNVLLKGGNGYPYIKLTISEPYPRALITRRIERDGALYFGPFLPPGLAYDTIRLIEKYFLIRNCDLEIDGRLDRPCLDYFIKRCMGPCVNGLCTKENYDQAVKDVRLFLEGKSDELIKRLTQRMSDAAQREHYELATYYRDALSKIRAAGEKQKMILQSVEEADIFGYHQEGRRLALQAFTMRGNKVVGRREFYWENLDEFTAQEFFSSTLRQYYLNDTYVPTQIIVPVELEDQTLIEQWLSERRGRRVKILQPMRGEKAKLLELVQKNAQAAFAMRFRILKAKNDEILSGLQAALGLESAPRRIECFDISNIQGRDSVASLVVCENGVMKKSAYRKFKIATVDGPDDFASICEAVHRRYLRVLKETPEAMPDLVLVDGGVGQLHAAARALAELGLERQPLAAIAKREEVLYVKGREGLPVRLDKTTAPLHLVQRIRDEAHRFAVTYHRKRRAMRDFSSDLLEIPGVGAKRKTELLRYFGSLERIKTATIQELRVRVGQKLAQEIVYYFNKQSPLAQ